MLHTILKYNVYFCFVNIISACRNRTFGSDCKFICSGNCENNETCDRTNGACVNCAPGWEKQYCNKSKKIEREKKNTSNAHLGLNIKITEEHSYKIITMNVKRNLLFRS